MAWLVPSGTLTDLVGGGQPLLYILTRSFGHRLMAFRFKNLPTSHKSTKTQLLLRRQCCCVAQALVESSLLSARGGVFFNVLSQ